MTYTEFLESLSKPARQALIHEGIDSFQKLADLTQKEVLAIHGVGPKSIPTMTEGLKEKGLNFKA